MDIKHIVMAGLLVGGWSATSQASLIPIGTGLDASGNLLAAGKQEQNYVVTGNDTAAVVDSASGLWVGNQPAGQWIDPVGANGGLDDATGYTYYTLTLDGTGTVSGEFSCDDTGYLLVNGVQVATTSASQAYGSLFAFSGNLTQSVNTLEFVVDNDGGPTGLLVEGNFDTGSSTAVPEASTWFAGAMLLLPLGFTTVRILRRKQIL